MAHAAAGRSRRTTVLRRAVAGALLVLAVMGLSACRSADRDGRTTDAVATTAPGGGLPRLDVTASYVTGISSGGYMATQLQVAYSSRFDAAGIFSAGPYYCALGNVVLALQSCTAYRVPSYLPALFAKTDAYARYGKIDPTAHLAQSRTWFFHGTEDPTVARPVADNLAEYYRHYDVPLTYRDATRAGHGWISPLGPVPCASTAPPYLNDCTPYDAQADMLKTMLGSVRAPSTGAPRGAVTAFSQDAYAVPPSPGLGDITRRGAAAIGMGRTGYLYTPTACARGARCAVVLALHGCQQTADQIGTTFVEQSGLNAYADTNAFVVLYPQARPDIVFGNPKGCWDWWGYLGPGDADYATREAPQMATVMNMVSALGG